MSSLSVERSMLDNLMINHVRNSNVQLLEGFKVTGLLFEGENVCGVKGYDEIKKEFTIKAKIVIENLPFFMKPGIIKYDVMNVKCDNGCRLVGQATTAKAGNITTISSAQAADIVTNNGKVSNIVQTTVSGNAGSATKLLNARTIAGVSFNGTANIALNNANITNGAGYVTKDTNTTYTAGTGLALTGTVFSNTITNNNQLTNGAGYITGISSGNVTTALGYTPWNYGSVDAGRNIGASTNLDTDLESGGAYGSYGAGGTSWNAPFSYGAVIAFAFTSGIKAQFGFDIRHNQSDYGDLRYRTKNNLGYSTWRTMWHSGNLTNNNQLTNGAGYITSSGSITPNWNDGSIQKIMKIIYGIS